LANFTTHIAVGTLVSGTLATLTLATDLIAPQNLVAVTLAGVLGSVLPDIDLKDSRPAKALFSGLAVFLSFAVLFSFAETLSIAEMWLLWIGTFLFVRYPLKAMFHNFSYHRGIWHSIIAGLFFAFLTIVVFKMRLGRHEGVAWLAGGFMLAGYLTHLILDEIYSVDVLDTRIKASFGTALKIYDGRKPLDSVVVASAAVALFVLTPSPSVFVDGITSKSMWAGLQRRFLPQDDTWFGLVRSPRFIARRAAVSGIETGSVVAPPPAAAPAADVLRTNDAPKTD
jgi:hypothetical protein